MNALSSAATLLLSASGASSPAMRERMPSASDQLVLAANGRMPAEDRSGAPVRLGSAIGDSLFSVNHMDVTKLKVDLMERVGKAFGLEMHDYKDMKAFARAISSGMSQLDASAIKAIEAELGLDKLGVSLREVVDAMQNPEGSSDDKLESALLDEIGDAGSDRKKAAAGIVLDEIGRYGPPFGSS